MVSKKVASYGKCHGETSESHRSLVIGCGIKSQRNLCSCSNLVAFDINHFFVEEAKRTDPLASYVVADARFIPFKSHAFFDIVSTEVLEHIRDYRKSVDEILRLDPKMVFLTFPTEMSDQIISAFSKTYAETARRIHVSIIDIHYLKQKFLKNGYSVSVSLSWAFNMIRASLLCALLDVLHIDYSINEVGQLTFKNKRRIYDFLVKSILIISRLGAITALIWRVFRLRTFHDSYKFRALKSNLIAVNF